MQKVQVSQVAKGLIVEFIVTSQNNKVVHAKVIKTRKYVCDLIDINDGSLWGMCSDTLVKIVAEKLGS